MTHFLCLIYLSFTISVVISVTATNDPSKMLRRSIRYFAFMAIGSIAVGWLMLFLS